MRGSLKLVLGLGLVSAVAFGTAACGDDDEGGGGSGGGKGGSGGSTGGTGGGSTGGTAGTGGGTAGTGGGTAGSGGTDGGTSITCGSNTCSGWKVAGAIDVSPCCAGASKDKCGADVTAQSGKLLNLPADCYELNQPGNVDCTSCPQKEVKDLQGKPAWLDGCCMPDKTCGINIDISKAPYNGPNIGCLPYKTFGSDAGAPSCTPGTSPDGGCPDPKTDGGTDGGGSDASSDAKAD